MAEEKNKLTPYQKIRGDLDGWGKNHITALLPDNMPWERFRGKMLHALMASPQVQNCTQVSIIMSAIKAATMQLEIGTQAHLVPFKSTCTLVPDYKGLVALMYRAGCKKVTARAVFKNDVFDYQYGTDEYIKHKPSMEGRFEKDLVFAYCIVTLPNGETFFRVIDRAEIDKTRNRSAAGKAGPWVTDFEAMAVKTAVKRLAPFIQVESQHLRDAVDMDTKVEIGDKAAIDAEFQDVDKFTGEIMSPPAAVEEKDDRPKADRLADKVADKPVKPAVPAASPEHAAAVNALIAAIKERLGHILITDIIGEGSSLDDICAADIDKITADVEIGVYDEMKK